VDVHKGEGDPAHVDACGPGRNQKPEFFVDVINGWPLRTRQKNWIGHIVRGDSLQRQIMEGRMEWKRERGRPRQRLMNRMMEDGYWKLKEKVQQ